MRFVFYRRHFRAGSYPATELAEIAKFSGAKLVEVNPDETPMTNFCDFSLKGNAGEVLPIL